MWVAPMKDLTNLLCQCQTDYSAVATDFCFELLGPPDAVSTCEHGLWYSGQLVTDRVTSFGAGSVMCVKK